MTPFVCLTILSRNRAHTAKDISFGSLAYYYEALIQQALDATKLTIDFTTTHAFLACVASKIFSRHSSQLSWQELQEVHREYCDSYETDFNLDTTIHALASSRILSVSSNDVSFDRPYQFHYFLASYIRHQLGMSRDCGDARQILDYLVGHLHRRDETDSLIFLTYLTDDSLVIDKVLETTRGLLSDITPARLEADVEFLNEGLTLDFNVPPEEPNPERGRKAERRRLDREDGLSPDTRRGVYSDGWADSVDAITREVDAAFSAIRVLGQMLRHFAGATPRDLKHDIAAECVSLALRLHARFIMAISAAKEECVSDFTKHAEELGATQDQNPEELARRFLLLIVVWQTANLIDQLANNVGSPVLERTYDWLVRENGDTAHRLIDGILRLKHSRHIDIESLARLRKDLGDNWVSQATLITFIFWRFNYYPPRDHSIRQRLYEKLELKPRAKKRLEIIACRDVS